MNAITKEVRKSERITENYLQTYKEFIEGYKQYKKDKSNQYSGA